MKNIEEIFHDYIRIKLSTSKETYIDGRIKTVQGKWQRKSLMVQCHMNCKTSRMRGKAYGKTYLW